MPKLINHEENLGKKFGHLTVKEIEKSDRMYYICQCDCGREKKVIASNLLKGYTKSCGCLECFSEKRIEHAREMGKATRVHAEICDCCGKKEHYARGLCRNCYTRYLRNGDTKYRHNYGGQNGK